VVWMIRAYREGLSQDEGIAGALGRIVPRGIRYAIEGIKRIAKEGTEPLRSAFRANPERPSTIRRAVRGMGGLLLAPLIAIHLVMHLTLALIASLLITIIFPLCLLVYGVVRAIGLIVRIVLWIPMQIFDVAFTAFRDMYVVTLRQLLHFSPIILLIVLALAVHSGMLAKDLGRELIPPLKQGEFGLRMQAPAGTRLEETDRRARKLTAMIQAVPEVDTVSLEVGGEDTSAASDQGENIATFTISLIDPALNAQRQDEIIDGLRRALVKETPDMLTFTLPTLFSFKTAVELQIRGDDLDELRLVGERALEAIEGVPGVTDAIAGLQDAELSMKQGYPEVIIELDRDLLASKNIDPAQVAESIRREVQGDVPTRFSAEGYKIDIRVRANRDRLSSVEALRQLSIMDSHPPLPLSSVAKITVKPGPSEIRRIDQRQVAVVTANVEGRDLGAVSDDILARIQDVEKPRDFVFVLGGQNRELQTSYQSLQFALLLAIFLVYVVMACQFESIWHPALVMFAVPLAFIGVVYVLVWLDVSLSIVVFIGGIILAGIVVNDAIVLVDYINQLRERGMKKRDAVVEAGRVRLRPIIMTTLTTVLGLIPMAVWAGEGAEIRQPMAITVMAGLSSATLLTLVIIPMAYDLFGGRDKT
jgi:hydrophobic/amphiphilic exporter-1 (mainly G- bacteria), HAE1 family